VLPTGWHYYCWERGLCRDERMCDMEDEAYDVFLRTVLKDPTTKVPR